MYKLNRNLRFEGVTYKKGDLVESKIEKYAHCFDKVKGEKEEEKRERRGRPKKQ